MANYPHVKRALFGVGRRIVVYDCRNCAAKLKSPLGEAGTTDTCPACGISFIVPGEDERNRMRNEAAEREQAKRAKLEAKCQRKAKQSSSEPLSPTQVDSTSSPVESQPFRRRRITAIATAASLAILLIGGLAYHLGRGSGVAQQEAKRQASVWDESVWEQPRASSATPLKQQNANPSAPNTENWWENDPIADGTKESTAPKPADTRHVIAAAEQSVVTLKVSIRDQSAAAAGSGFVLRPGIVVTNYHVVEDAATVSVKFKNGRETQSAGYLAASKENDLALVKCDTTGSDPLPLGALPEKLDPVFAIGSPHGVYSGTISNGIVSGLVERKRKKAPTTIWDAFAGQGEAAPTVMIQTTAPISPGNSGGPLLNEKGEVVGVTTSTLIDAQNVNFAVAAVHVEKLLASTANVARPWRELPVSVESTRRAKLRRLAAEIDEAAELALKAGIQCDKTWELYLVAQSECEELARHQKAFLDQMENFRLAGNRVMFEQYTRELDSGRVLAEIKSALGKRDELKARLREEKKNADDLMKKAQSLRRQYDEIRKQQLED